MITHRSTISLRTKTALTASLVGLCVAITVPAFAAVEAQPSAGKSPAPLVQLAQATGAATDGTAGDSAADAPAAAAAPTADEQPAAAPAAVAEQPAAPAEATAAEAAPVEAAPAEPAPAVVAAPAPAVTPAPAPEVQVVEIEEPTDPVAKAAFDMLDVHCARCHQDGKLNRLRPAKNFGNVLKLDELARDPNLIQPGNPDASRLYKQIVKQEMPYDVYYEFDGTAPTADEVGALRTWIESLGSQQASACTTRNTMSNQEMVDAITADLQSEADHRLKGMRYVTLTNLYNACMPEEDMNVFRQAVVKLLNSLSQESDVLRLTTVDEQKTIIKFNLEDLGWTAADWDKLLSVYPYAVKPDIKTFDVLKQTSGTELPYIRGDWLAFAASRPPLYFDLLKLPANFNDLQKSLGLDINANLEKFLAKRSGFQVSGVSRNNRMIERHSINTGVFWTSYDFAGNKGTQSLFEHPLGPTGDNAFVHDGGETIWSLPNGFNAYYLNTATGDKLNIGPTNIVQDTTQKDLSVTNGISCFGCHDQGFRKAKDEIRAHVAKDRTFSKEVREAVEALYVPHAEMDGLIDQDIGNFRAAMQRAGLEPDLKLGGVEMINALSKQYEKDVSLAHAASEFGLTSDELVERLAGASGESFRIKRRLEQGVIPRDTFEPSFKAMLANVTDDSFITVAAAAAPAAGEAAAAAAAPAATDGAAAAAPVATVAATKESPGVNRDFELALFSDKSEYAAGDLAVFTVTPKTDCNLTLINVDGKGIATVIFPNKFEPNNFVKAGQEVRLPGEAAPYQFRLKDPGTETVVAACNATTRSVDGIKQDFTKEAFTDLGVYKDFVTRAITIEQAAPKAEGKKASEEAAETGKISAKGDVLARTAVKFAVK